MLAVADIPGPSTVRVVVADDSALMRQIVSNSLIKAGVDVVGGARDGDEALALCERERPDAMTLDLAMPGLDGLGVLRELRRPGRTATPVVVVSAFSPATGARAVDALAEGAFDLVAKPRIGDGYNEFAEALVEKVTLAASAGRAGQMGLDSLAARATRPRGRDRTTAARAVVIATSTGGPRALAALVPRLPSPLGIGTLIVQHMPAGFTRSLAARLDATSKLTVREAEGGEIMDPRTALIAPGGRHLRIAGDGRTRLSDEAEIGGLRPRADLTIADAARTFGERLLLVVLTGMGSDSLLGAREVRRLGGRILAEAPQTCAVHGMPRAVVEANLSDGVLPLDGLAAVIAEEAGR
jgi:two-component system, chemotaxis family, protein-glutamate methylesterase/glutaminase